MLLSRVAGDIYWAARYLERAEDTARVVRAHAETVADLPGRREAHWKPLITVVGSDAQYDERFGGDGSGASGRRVPPVRPAQPGQRRPLRRRQPARTCAPRARRSRSRAGRRSTTSTTTSTSRPIAAPIVGPATGSLAMSSSDSRRIDGILATTMSHDEAYAMWRLGRALERADMTTRVLGVRAAPC